MAAGQGRTAARSHRRTTAISERKRTDRRSAKAQRSPEHPSRRRPDVRPRTAARTPRRATRTPPRHDPQNSCNRGPESRETASWGFGFGFSGLRFRSARRGLATKRTGRAAVRFDSRQIQVIFGAGHADENSRRSSRWSSSRPGPITDASARRQTPRETQSFAAMQGQHGDSLVFQVVALPDGILAAGLHRAARTEGLCFAGTRNGRPAVCKASATASARAMVRVKMAMSEKP